MRLSDLSQEQAQTLADLYLTNLLNQGVEQMDEVQMAIHNGLSFYASNLHWQDRLNSDVECVKGYAQLHLSQYEPLVVQCEDYVNEWLSQTFDTKS